MCCILFYTNLDDKDGTWKVVFPITLYLGTLSGCCVPSKTVASPGVAQGTIYISECCADDSVQEILFSLDLWGNFQRGFYTSSRLYKVPGNLSR